MLLQQPEEVGANPRFLLNFLVKAGVIVGSGGLIFGYDIGVIAGTLSQLQSRFPNVPTVLSPSFTSILL